MDQDDLSSEEHKKHQMHRNIVLNFQSDAMLLSSISVRKQKGHCLERR